MGTITFIAIATALIAAGSYHLAEDNPTRGELAAAVAAGLGVGMIFGGFIHGVITTAREADKPECRSGQVYVTARHNQAGAEGCIPFYRLKDITE